MRTLLTLAAAAAVATAPALAQPLSTFVDPAPVEGGTTPTPRVSAQTLRALGSPSEAVRAAALHAVLTMAFETAEPVDIRPAIPALFDVFRTDPNPGLRLLALRSLEATDDADVMTALRHEVAPEARRLDDARVRHLLLAILIDRYGVDELRTDRDVAALYKTLPAVQR